jgi:hypothetical protein
MRVITRITVDFENTSCFFEELETETDVPDELIDNALGKVGVDGPKFAPHPLLFSEVVIQD